MLMSNGRPKTQVPFQPRQLLPNRNVSGPPTFPLSNQWISSPSGCSSGNIPRHPAPAPFQMAPFQPDQAVRSLPSPPNFSLPNEVRPSLYELPSSCNAPSPLSCPPATLPALISTSQQDSIPISEFVKQIVKATIREYQEFEQTRKEPVGDEIANQCSLSISPIPKGKQWCRWEIGMVLVLSLFLVMIMCYIG